MREAQAEIKAIEAQLRSIRVDSDSSPSQRVLSTSLEPSSTRSKSRNTTTQRSPQGQSQGQLRQNSGPATRRSVESASSASLSSVSSPPSRQVEGYPLPSKHRPPSHLAATIDRLQEQSAIYVEQYKRVQSQAFQTPEQMLEQTLKILESQVRHINQLSDVQETAILELKTIAEQVEQEWKAIEQSRGRYGESELDTLPICEYLGVAVPQIEQNKDGSYVLSARSIDLFKAEREATLTAQALRHWANRKNPAQLQSTPPSLWQRFSDLLSPAEPPARSNAAPRTGMRSPSPMAVSGQSPQPARPAVRSRRRRTASSSVLRLKEAVALFLGAVIVRVVLDMVMASFPVLWTPAIALLVTPAAIAVYRSSHTPQSGLVWGYRLLIIMIGLLLGGRL